MLNVETDVTVGLFLHQMAQRSGCVYTVSTGDEPGVCKQLFVFSRVLGFEVVCLGKGKNNPINYYATPETAREEAERKNMNPKMLAAFQDGTKTMVEMAAMANATGLVPDTPGGHGPKADLADLNKVCAAGGRRRFEPPRLCGLLDGESGGVFAIIATKIRGRGFEVLAMGDGPTTRFTGLITYAA